MKSVDPQNHNGSVIRTPFFYGWVIVAACTILQAIQFGILYSFGIFFKPLIADFGWSRATTSAVYSISMICGGVFAIPSGWLADKFSPAKVAAFCSFLTGLGLVLTSQVTTLWQLYLTLGVIVGIGSSGIFAIGTGIVARWFVKQRGFALGIVSAGIGMGTLVVSPVAERLIVVLGWSQTYYVFGLIAWILMITSSLFLRRDPKDIGGLPYGITEVTEPHVLSIKAIRNNDIADVITPATAFRTRSLWILISIYFLLSICTQMIIVHLANYATDLGTTPLIAATIVAVIGIGSIIGRLAMGSISDRISSNNALIICCFILTLSFIWLIFSKQPWMLYLFAFVFSFAYGGEVPLIPSLIDHFFGLSSVSTLIGAIILFVRVGGALGSWIGGQIFDLTQSYILAFIIAIIAGIIAVSTAFKLKYTK